MQFIRFIKLISCLAILFFLVACGSSDSSSSEKNTPITPVAIDYFELSINFITPNSLGSITVQPDDITCHDSCITKIAANSHIEISANIPENSTFDGWPTTCEVTEDNKCALTMNKAHSLQVGFSTLPQSYTLSIHHNIGGKLLINGEVFDCTTPCEKTFVEGSLVSLIPQEDSGYYFSNWSGICANLQSCNFIVTENIDISALFKESPATIFDKNTNSILITEPHGEDQQNYPIQIGRPFIQGEIVNYPQILIDGVIVESQADVKQRYSDGSVKHAILSFIVPHISANSSKVISFTNIESNNVIPLTKTQILQTNFSATIALADKQRVSARDMIQTDKFTYWLQGPIATSIIIADHSTTRTYDLGNDQHRSIRPQFHITFWPSINKYQVRYIAESSNTESLQDQTYNLSLTIEEDSNVFYQKSNVPHQAMSKWTKTQWSGVQLKTLSINHNINYLVRTKAFPNFDVSRSIPATTIDNDWRIWQEKSIDIYDKGLWQTAMATAGGRPDIGLYPTWTVKWLFSGDWRHQEIALKQSDLASAWPIYLREGDSHRKFDFDGNVEAIGRVLSMAPLARPTHWTARPDWHEVNPNDKVNYVGAHDSTIWRPDTAHHPDISTPQYILTGDYYYLEQMMFSAAYVSGDNNAKGFKSTLGRGPTGSEGGLYAGEVRGQAWALRTRINAYDIIPDSFPEKVYFDTLNHNAITMWEGLMGLTLSNKSHTDLYDFVRDNVTQNEFKQTKEPSPIGQWDEGVTSASYLKPERVNTEVVSRAMAPWMQNFIIVALGRAKELGYPTNSLLAFSGQQLLASFGDDDLPHSMISAYIVPTLNINNQWFTSWAEIYNQYTTEYIKEVEDFTLSSNDAEHGMHSIAMAAASFLAEHENHEKLWLFVTKNIANKEIYHTNPKWAILPR